ncbi:MAG: hypothetical protein Q8L74_16560 [Nitrospirota bacterium]|nr:hypothetical protein [Nitrospirota bacterium]MDP2384536.1 hypothetical protein [Nitrospirota bacterium]MDP3597535.1 hypothetical protein [Nitrospirota bacterium]
MTQFAKGLFVLVLVTRCPAPLFGIMDHKIETGTEAPVTSEQIKTRYGCLSLQRGKLFTFAVESDRVFPTLAIGNL